MLKINDIADFFFSKFPVQSQEEWDNSGLFYNFFNFNCNGVVVGLDLTQDLIQTALDHNANFIITHHPIYLNDTKTPIHPDKRHLMELLQDNKLVHLCMHTCFDKALDGTTYQLIKYLPNVQTATPAPDSPYVYHLSFTNPIKLIDLVKHLNYHDISQQPLVYDAYFQDKEIKTLALCAGSGGFYVHDAINNPNIDAYMCGDIKWHDWLDAWDNDFPMIDINHATEAIFIEYISDLLQKNFNLEPVKVYPKLRLTSVN